MLAERHLHRIEQLDQHQDEKGTVEQIDDSRQRRTLCRRLPEADRAADQQNRRARREQEADPDVDDVLDERECTCDDRPCRLCFRPVVRSGHTPPKELA